MTACFFFAFFSIAISSAYSQGPSGYVDPKVTDGSKAASGVLITAALESVGYLMQSRVLDNLSEMIGWLAALVYLGIILSVILTVAMHGNYKPVLWMLVGPPIFAFVSGVKFTNYENRTEAAGVEWRMGAFKDAANSVPKVIMASDLKMDPKKAPRVSYLFHQYNKLISEIMQRLIYVITSADVKKQLIFMARQRTLQDLFGMDLKDPGSRALTYYFLVHCNSEIAAARFISRGLPGVGDRKMINQPEYLSAVRTYCDNFDRPDKPFEPGPWKQMAYKIGYGGEDYKKYGSIRPQVSRERHIQTGEEGYDTISCKGLWLLTLEAIDYEVRNNIDWNVTNLDYSNWVHGGDDSEEIRHTIKQQVTAQVQQTFSEVLQDVLTKLETKKGQPPKSTEDPCPELFRDADAVLKSHDLDIKHIQRLNYLLSGIIFRKYLVKHPSAEILTRIQGGRRDVVEKDDTLFSRYSGLPGYEPYLRKNLGGQFAEARNSAFRLLMMLPYLQGVILFVLSVSYPFFAMLLLLPSHAAGFMTWMFLWAWAKSWDAGWALVMVADEMLWQLLPHYSFYNPESATAYRDPVSVLEGAFAGDPSYNINTYWSLLSIMIMGVPLVTAQAIIGSRHAIAATFLKGLQSLSNSAGGISGDWVAMEQTAAYVGMRERDQLDRIFNKSTDNFATLYNSHKDVRKTFSSDPVSRFLGRSRDLGRSAMAALTGNEELQKMQDEQIKDANAEQRLLEHSAFMNAMERSLMSKSGGMLGALNPEQLLALMSAPDDDKAAQETIQQNTEYIITLLDRAGLLDDIKKQGKFVDDPALNARFQELAMENVADQVRALAFRNQAELDSLAAIPLFFAGSGVLGRALGVQLGRLGLDSAAGQKTAFLEMNRKTLSRQLELMSMMNAQIKQESYYMSSWDLLDALRGSVAVNRPEWYILREYNLDLGWKLDQYERRREMDNAKIKATAAGRKIRDVADIVNTLRRAVRK